MRRPSNFWTLQLAGWSAFYVAMALSRMGRFPLLFMLAEKLPLTLLGVVASLALRAILKPLLARQTPMAVVVTVCVVSSYVLASVWTAAFNVVEAPIAAAMLGRRSSINSLGQLFGGTVYHAFSLVAWGFLYLGIKHHRAWQAERDRALRAEALVATARLDALRHQLDPHFFFNALNAVSTLIVERRNDEAASMIAKLGDFLRTTIRGGEQTHVSLADEIGYARRYLEIEQVRFGDRLAVRFEIDEDAHRAMVPILILQPLVENAVRHGIAVLPAGGVVSIAARQVREGGHSLLQLSILNTAPASPATTLDDDGGIGLRNVRERLAILYGSNHHFSATHDGLGLYRVELRIPLAGTGPA